jgi:hypothetical protein
MHIRRCCIFGIFGAKSYVSIIRRKKFAYRNIDSFDLSESVESKIEIARLMQMHGTMAFTDWQLSS